MLLIICCLAVAAVIIGAVYYRSFAFFPFAAGVVLGAGVNIVKIKMIERVVKNATNAEKTISPAYVPIQNILRFLLTAIVLGLAAFFDFISLLGAAVGIITMPIAGYSLSVFGGNEKMETPENNDEPVDNTDELDENDA